MSKNKTKLEIHDRNYQISSLQQSYVIHCIISVPKFLCFVLFVFLLSGEICFSFSDSSIPSIAKLSRTQQQQRNKTEKEEKKRQQNLSSPTQSSSHDFTMTSSTLLVSPSPYHLLSLYVPFLSFSQSCENLLGSSCSLNRVADFLQMFCSTNLLPRIQADTNLQMEHIFKQTTAFDPKVNSIQKAKKKNNTHKKIKIQLLFVYQLMLTLFLFFFLFLFVLFHCLGTCSCFFI